MGYLEEGAGCCDSREGGVGRGAHAREVQLREGPKPLRAEVGYERMRVGAPACMAGLTLHTMYCKLKLSIQSVTAAVNTKLDSSFQYKA